MAHFILIVYIHKAGLAIRPQGICKSFFAHKILPGGNDCNQHPQVVLQEAVVRKQCSLARVHDAIVRKRRVAAELHGAVDRDQ
jgi:hypothetical protein